MTCGQTSIGQSVQSAHMGPAACCVACGLLGWRTRTGQLIPLLEYQYLLFTLYQPGNCNQAKCLLAKTAVLGREVGSRAAAVADQKTLGQLHSAVQSARTQRSMGQVLAKCIAQMQADPEPPVVFTICEADGKAHEFGQQSTGMPIEKTASCLKCKKDRMTIDLECRMCREGNHDWVQNYEPVCNPCGPVPDPTQGKAMTAKPGAPPVAQAVPVQMVYKCKRCGLRQQMNENGVYVYDDYYMYGGGYMMGMEMGLMFGIMGASDYAYADPMYQDYYAGDDMGFDADGGGDDFDFD